VRYFLNLFYVHSLPRHKIVDLAVIMVTGRPSGINGGFCKSIQIIHKLNWLGLFEKFINTMKMVNHKDNLMAPGEQSFSQIC
jgi:hypothetical protein